MSTLSNPDEYFTNKSLLRALHVAVGDAFLCNVDQKITELLQSIAIVDVLERKKIDIESIDKFGDALETLKLILDMLTGFVTQNNSILNSTFENILLCVRDVIDIKPSKLTLKIALNILRLVCILCAHSKRKDVVQYLSNFYLYQMHLVQRNDNSEDLILRLKVLNIILQILIDSNDTDIVDLFKKGITEDNTAIDTFSLFSHLIFHDDDEISGEALINLLPRYIQVFSNFALQNIWNAAVNIKENKSDVKQFTVLCFIFDLLSNDHTTEGEEIYIKILEDEIFWKTQQFGLTHAESVVRRQSLYLLRRSIQDMVNRSLTINSRKFNELCGTNFKQKLDEGVIKLTNGMKNFTICNNKMFLLSSENSNVMWWNSTLNDGLLTLFNDIFLVLETSEEKQVHIVKPVCNTMVKIMEAAVLPFRNGKCLHFSWILVLFQRLLQNDSVPVVRWGLLKLMEIDSIFYHRENLMLHIIRLLVTHLNNSSLFLNEADDMLCHLRKYFDRISADTEVVNPFLQRLIQEICSVKWGPEPLYIVLESMKDVKVHCLQSEHLLLIKEFVLTSISTQYTFLRSAVQCQLLTLILNLTDVSTANLETICDVLGTFRRQECLTRGCKSWISIANWIEYCFSKRCAEEYIFSNIAYKSGQNMNPEKASKMLCLLYDAHLFGIMRCCGETPSVKITNVLFGILGSFKDADKRLYAPTEELTHNLNILYNILKENLVNGKSEPCHLVEMMLPYVGDILAYILCRSRDTQSHVDHSFWKLLVGLVRKILEALKLYRIDAEPFASTVYQHSLKTLGVQEPLQSSSFEKYVCMHFLMLILEFVYQEKTIPKLKQLQLHFRIHINQTLPKSELADDASIWGRINAEYLEAQWHIINRLRNENLLRVGNKITVEVFLTNEELANECQTALQLGTGKLLIPIIRVAEDLLPDLTQETTAKLVRDCWVAVLETRKSDAFFGCICQFIRMLFQTEIVAKSSCKQLLLEYSSHLLSDLMNGVANCFMTHIQTLGVKYTPNVVWSEILAQAVVFPPVSHREDRLTLNVCQIIENTPNSANELVSNDWNTGAEVRARALQILLTLSPGSHTNFADSVADALINKELQVTRNKSRHFAGSIIHLIRTRILQCLLIIEPNLSEDRGIALYQWLCSFLLRESQQPSVRYLAEWLIVRLLWRIPDLQDSLWLNFNEAVEQRVGSLCSFISVMYHTLQILPDHVLEDWLDRAVTQFLPYCLAQHFSLRLYSQVILDKMWLMAEQRNLVDVLQKYSIIRSCLSRHVGNGNALRNAEKLKQDFYWTIFHPLHHFSLQTIFRDLPRLAHIKAEEWISPELFSKVGVSKPSLTIPWSSGDDLWLHPVAAWNIRHEEDALEIASENFQKKMVPIKSLVPDYEQLLGVSQSASTKIKHNNNDGLVVVGSLLEKTSNLGGLSRTCEIFGVSELVIDSLQLLEDKQFQSLSVTAEKWVPITEVKAHYLSDYLARKKEEGYTIVGAEQTSKSLQLHQTVFPKKSLLLMGNEKEGLPTPLLPLLDLCIEIPQLGVIRSLNVHVTASLFIWEYAKQHSLV